MASISLLLDAIGDNSENTRKFFSTQLEKKSIVLKNTTKQVKAFKTSNRSRVQTLQHRFRISRSAMEKAGLLQDLSKRVNTGIKRSDVYRTHSMWLQFMRKMVKDCNTGDQLKSRLNLSGLLGAYITVVDSYRNSQRTNIMCRPHSQRPLCGYVVSESKNCLYIAEDSYKAFDNDSNTLSKDDKDKEGEEEEDGDDNEHEDEKETSIIEVAPTKVDDAREVRVSKMIRDASVFRVTLPCALSSGGKAFIDIKGDKFNEKGKKKSSV